MVFEGFEALELGVEGVGGGLDVFAAAVRGEEDCGVDGDADGHVAVGVEAAHCEDWHGAGVEGVHVIAEALGVADVEVGDFEEGWGAEEVAEAVAVDGDEGDGVEGGVAGGEDLPGAGGGEVAAPDLVAAGVEDADLFFDVFAELAFGEGDVLADADLAEGGLGAEVVGAPAEDLFGVDLD